jgi:hypothetical protein
MPQSWEQEWQVLARWRDRALERSRQIQAQITATLRRREPRRCSCCAPPTGDLS